MTVVSLSTQQTHAFLTNHPEAILLDVREANEREYCAIANSVHIPMNKIPLYHNQLDDVPIVVYCHHGIRSLQVANYLSEVGFEEVYNLAGGIDAWAVEQAPDLPRY